jgi:hypothetical protein
VRSKASFTKKLHLVRVAELTPRRKKLYNMIWTREIALCKLRKKCRAKKPKEVCQLDSNPLIQSLSSSFNVDTSRFLVTIFRNSKHDPKGRRWSYKEKVCILKYSARSDAFLWSLFPYFIMLKLVNNLVMYLSFKFILTLYSSKSRTVYMFVIFSSGQVDNDRHLTMAVFVKGVVDPFNNFIGVMCCPYCRKLLHCHLTITSKNMEDWRNAVDKMKSRTFLNKNRSKASTTFTNWLVNCLRHCSASMENGE